MLPPALALRKEAEDALEAAYTAPSERIARKIIEDVNVRIKDMMFKPPPGPPLGRSRTTSSRSYGNGGSAGLPPGVTGAWRAQPCSRRPASSR